uniref:Entry-fusion-complex G9/A16 n=1 Tax=Pithovirus LCPAC304 TaxID=2506594 RepID=A0A481Z9J0_9VIRU|nr:MAG: entry-fusion-complex G9/A16 [Pithovirus LCPAC304]
MELFDWEKNVNALIAQFVPDASDGNIATENQNCAGGQTSEECKEWDKINHKLLKSYCQRISYFPRGANPKGECPLYQLNPFNPDLPQSKGCNKMTNQKSVCSKWYDASTQTGILQYVTIVNDAIGNYCPNVTTPDCACQEVQKSIVFKEVSGVAGDTRCWWRPCQLSSQGRYLIQSKGLPKCDENVCININNVFLDNSVIGGDVINEELNACGGGVPPPPWYEQWWFWIIVLAIVIILFATLIYFGAQT